MPGTAVVPGAGQLSPAPTSPGPLFDCSTARPPPSRAHRAAGAVRHGPERTIPTAEQGIGAEEMHWSGMYTDTVSAAHGEPAGTGQEANRRAVRAPRTPRVAWTTRRRR